MPEVSFPAAVPEIPVRDVAASADDYQRSLGFTPGLGRREARAGGHLEGKLPVVPGGPAVSRGIRQRWTHADLAEPGKQGRSCELHRVWSVGGARLISAPESKPWGLHEFTATDLDGNLLRVFYDFATPERAADA